MRRHAILLSSTLLALASSFHLTALHAQQTSEPVRVAIVGLEHGHVDGFLSAFSRQHDAQLVAVVDPDPALQAKAQKNFQLPSSLFYSDLDKAVAATHPQALLVYTSVGEHRHVIEAAARLGLDVMVEKPLAISLDDALAIRHLAREHHIQVLVNYETTWYASNKAVLDMASSGKLGDVRKVVVHDGHQGPAEIGVQPEFLKWLTDPALNGAGALYDFGCYGADLMTVLMQGKAPISVTASAQTDKPGTYPRVDDDATIILRYPGTQAVLMPSWNWTFSRKDMEVYGTKAYAIAVNSKEVKLRTAENTPEEEFTADPLKSPEDTSLHYLAAVVRRQLDPGHDLTSLPTNVTVVQILDAARHSAATGRTVELQPLPPDGE
ncbi:Gfo/Idh/MocA family protein [Silvibacterium dinghuense]|uniref:Gfo/Idh/MocA family oxidoreductase n=1 Tax=Silvibacterium dinghuense TaxID=1560006 RepID=A0A4Q1SCM0_9BACT|nr:Gfo/Idh/MocA family oxidoreductase [Silvibacterium dinghuense]RXS94966.1 Gfo/Idh/MocA family oxidoreductase [Silvibacterium dinghuense]GGH09427.1 1,5-anhydro-D-fructose reductase [Silvibacterium dinghuense]